MNPPSLSLLLPAISFLVAGCSFFGPPPVPTFYNPPVPLEPGKPGDIIRTEPLSTPAGVKGWRVLYHSTGQDGSDVAVSGAFFAPAGPPPTGGFPVLAQAHGTTGIARGCAPSIDPFKSIPGLESFYDLYIAPFVAAGYAVALTDYQGMGAPGTYSYLIGALEGRNVLDSVRALRNLPEIDTLPETFVMGHSQGGQAAAFTAQLQPEYASDVPLSGVLLLAPAVELEELVKRVFDEPIIAPTSGLLLMVARAWPEQYPELKQSPILKPNVDLGPVENECVFGALIRTLKPPTEYFSESPDDDSAWAKRVRENTPDPARLRLPLWVAQGGKDDIVFPQSTRSFVQKVCAAGQPVQIQEYAESGHLDLPKYANADALEWMAAIQEGIAQPSAC